MLIAIVYVEMQSFQLQRKSGQKCYLLAARSLTIDCRNVDGEKEWIPMHDSRLVLYFQFFFKLYFFNGM